MPVIPAVITIAYEELNAPEESPAEAFSQEGFRATRFLKCAWADRITLAQELMGTVTSIETDGPGILWVLPHEYDHFDGAYVQGVSMRGFGGISGDSTAHTAAYNAAILTVEYSNASGGIVIDNDSDEVIEEGIEAGGQFLTLSEQKLYWDSGSTERLNPTEAPQYFQGLTDWTYSRKRVRVIPASFITLYGKVNDAQVTSRSTGITYDAETLLYSTFNIRRLITTTGAQAWDLNMRFTHNRQGWNKFRKRANATPQPIYAGGSVHKPYETGDFTSLVVQ